MGNYTSMVGAVRIKTEFKELANHFATYMYEELKKDEESYPFVKEFFQTERADWIPNNNPLDKWFFDETFFKNHMDGDVWYFSSNLKNYKDKQTGLSPIESFFANILENIATEIFLLEIASDDFDGVCQYAFSDNGKIKMVNYIDLIPSSHFSYGGYLPEEEKIDVFERFKKSNQLHLLNK